MEMQMSTVVARNILSPVDLETTGWNTKDPDLFLSMIHPDMVWPWPPTADSHDRRGLRPGEIRPGTVAKGLAGHLRHA
jgi:hypothetical protein